MIHVRQITLHHTSETYPVLTVNSISIKRKEKECKNNKNKPEKLK